jgi:hypothetical protein
MALGNIGEYRVIRSTREAQDILLYCWLVQGGDAFGYALEVCATTLNDQLPADEARHAFILAAKEAGAFIADKLPRHLQLVTPIDPNRKSTDMKFRPKKRDMRRYNR